MDKITIERETLKWAIRWHESRIWPGPDEVSVFDALRAALAQKAEPSMRPLPDHDNHHNALKCPYCNPRGLKFAEPADAQPTGKAPCARHCEAPAFEGEIRRLKREATIKDSLTIRPPAPAAVPLTDEKIDHTLATTLDEFARTTRGMSHALDVNADITANSRLRRMFARAVLAAGDKP